MPNAKFTLSLRILCNTLIRKFDVACSDLVRPDLELFGLLKKRKTPSRELLNVKQEACKIKLITATAFPGFLPQAKTELTKGPFEAITPFHQITHVRKKNIINI